MKPFCFLFVGGCENEIVHSPRKKSVYGSGFFRIRVHEFRQMLFGQMSEVNVAQRSGQRIALNETCFENKTK